MNGAVIIVGNYESPQRGTDLGRDFSGLLHSRGWEGGVGEEKGILLTFFLVTPFLRFLAVISFPAVER